MKKEALIIIDMQKDFLKFHRLYPKERQRPIVSKLQDVIAFARGKKL